MDAYCYWYRQLAGPLYRKLRYRKQRDVSFFYARTHTTHAYTVDFRNVNFHARVTHCSVGHFHKSMFRFVLFWFWFFEEACAHARNQIIGRRTKWSYIYSSFIDAQPKVQHNHPFQVGKENYWAADFAVATLADEMAWESIPCKIKLDISISIQCVRWIVVTFRWLFQKIWWMHVPHIKATTASTAASVIGIKLCNVAFTIDLHASLCVSVCCSIEKHGTGNVTLNNRTRGTVIVHTSNNNQEHHTTRTHAYIYSQITVHL